MTGMTLPSRTLLFVPGNRPDRFEKALASGANEVVFDLEDAVAPEQKEVARRAIADWLAGGRRALVRLNGTTTPWFAEDLKLVKSFEGASLMVPKADAQAVIDVARVLGGRAMIALVETVKGMEAIREWARAGVSRVAFGSVDFSADSGIEDVGELLTPIRCEIVIASRLAGLPPPVDGISLEIDDKDALTRSAARSKQMGFGGKLCIHPNQVAAVKAAFRPTQNEVRRARAVELAFLAANGGAVAVGGQMVDLPVYERAKRILISDKD